MSREKKSSRVAARAADALDLMIEFATLGEYGLEYPEPIRPASRKKSTPGIHIDFAGNHRPATGGNDWAEAEAGRNGSSSRKHRQKRRPCQPGRRRVELPGWGERPGQEVPGVQPGRRHKAEAEDTESGQRRGKQRNRPTSALPEVLRPPRIRFKAA